MLPEYHLCNFANIPCNIIFFPPLTLKESVAAVLLRLSWTHPSNASQEFILQGMIRARRIACLCSVDPCLRLFLQLGPFFTLGVINQLRRLNLKVQPLGLAALLQTWARAHADGPLSILFLPAQPTQLFSPGTPPQGIDFGPFCLCP